MLARRRCDNALGLTAPAFPASPTIRSNNPTDVAYSRLTDKIGARGKCSLLTHSCQNLDAFRLAGLYAGRVLNGEKLAELPVQGSGKVEPDCHCRRTTSACARGQNFGE